MFQNRHFYSQFWLFTIFHLANFGSSDKKSSKGKTKKRIKQIFTLNNDDSFSKSAYLMRK